MTGPVPNREGPGHGARQEEFRRVGRMARHASRNAWVERLSRLGLAVRGLLYFIPGLLTVEWALGRSGDEVTPASAIDVIGRLPLGRSLLLVVAVGLAGYTMWGLIRAIMDPLQRGRSPAGLAQRAGYLSSALAYLFLFIATVRILTNGPSSAGQANGWVQVVLTRPFGSTVLVGVGLCWILGSGVVQIASGWTGGFRKDLDLDHMRPAVRHVVVAIGRIGLIARGLVFTIVGLLILGTALHRYAQTQTGIDGALIEVGRQAYGRVLLAAAGIGLMTFGLYSVTCARWLGMNRRDAPAAPMGEHVA